MEPIQPSLLGATPGPTRFGEGITSTNKGKEVFIGYLDMAEGSHSRIAAIGELVASPITIPLRAAASIIGGLFNIITLGSLGVVYGRVNNTCAGRAKSMGCSALGIVMTPVTMAVSLAGRISHVFSPKTHKVDLLVAHMWTGFVAAERNKPS
jgi:hypothetical protein